MWASTDTFVTTTGTIRVRSSSPDTARIVRALLADRLVDDRVDDRVDWSVRLEPPAPAGAAQPLHLLYDGYTIVRRGRDPERIARALVDRVTAADSIGRADGRLHLAGCALVGARGAVVLPLELEPDVVHIERRLARSGLSLVDMPFLTFDVVTGELVVEPPTALDAEIIAGTSLYRGRDSGAAAPGRYRVTGWLVEGRLGGEPRESIMQIVRNPNVVDRDRLWRLAARMIDRALVLAAWRPLPADLVSAIVRLAESRR